MATTLTGGSYAGATRLDDHCWIDGNDDHLIIEFWHLPGSIFRSEYNRRTTTAKVQFVPVDSWEFSRLMMSVEPTSFCI